MQIIAVVNEKGGVAKTTTVISLGGALVSKGFTVLLVDLDAQANLSLGMGLTTAKIRRSIADVLLNSASLLSVSRETEIDGLDLIPSTAEMGTTERFLPVRQNYECVLKNAINSSPGISAYDFVILDCPPSLGAVTTNALNAANLVISPTQPEFFSTYGLRSLMAAIRRIRGQENPELLYYVLVTMMDRRNRIHRTIFEQLKTTFQEGLLNTVIEVDTKLRESAVVGLPITHCYPKSRSALQYTELAQELIDHVSEKAETQYNHQPDRDSVQRT